MFKISPVIILPYNLQDSFSYSNILPVSQMAYFVPADVHTVTQRKTKGTLFVMMLTGTGAGFVQ